MTREFRHVFARAALVLAYISDFFIAHRFHGFHGRLHRKECSQLSAMPSVRVRRHIQAIAMYESV